MPNPSADYPTSVHTNTDVSGYGSTALGSSATTHTDLEGKQEEEITAVQTKIGTGSSTPTANTVMRGTGAGTSAWGQVDVADVDATGTPSSSTFLRGDGSWAAPAGGGGGDLLAANNLSDVASASTSFTNIKQQASTTATGVVEIATTAEVDTGTDNDRAISPSALNGSSPTVNTTNMSDDTNKRFMTDAQETKLDSVETNADVTDTTNVTSAGALMDSEVTNLAQVKAFDSSDYATAAQGTTADSAVQPADGLDGLNGVDTDKSKTPADGDVLTFDGTDWNAEAGGGGGGISNVVEDTTPQLGGQLDVNGNAIGDGTNELITFSEDASAVNHINVENNSTGADPIISAAGDDTNISLQLSAKGTGDIKLGNMTFDADQSIGAGQDNYVLTYDNASTKISLEAAAGGGGGGQTTFDYVIGSGGDYATLNAYYADSPTAGDRLFIDGPHTLTASVTITTDSLTIIGSGKDDAIISIAGYDLRIDGDDLTVRDVGIDHSTQTTGAFRVNGDYYTVDNIKLTANSDGMRQYYVSGSYGVTTNSTFINSYTGSTVGNGFVEITGQYNRFIGNYVFGKPVNTNDTSAVFRIGGAGGHVVGNRFECSTSAGTNPVFVSIDGTHSQFSGNYLKAFASSPMVVGVEAGGQSNILITGNTFYGYFIKGVDVTGNKNSITNNQIYSFTATSATGVYIDASKDDVNVKGNYIDNFATGINVSASSCDRAFIDGNDVYNCTTGISDSGTSTTTGTNKT